MSVKLCLLCVSSVAIGSVENLLHEGT